MRLMEQNLYSSSLEANMNRLEPVHARTVPMPARKLDQPMSTDASPNISSAITNGTKNAVGNPFDEENYDEAKNPFADEGQNPTNPFSEDDDYDKNLNPFS